MTRKVFENSMVAHVWAQRSQSEGRSSNGQFYFTGDKLYSYGSHHLMGLHVDGGTLINSTSYSVTTSKHYGYARRSAHGTVFCVPDLTALDQCGGLRECNGKGGREALRRYLTKHYDSLSDDAARFLLRVSGQPELRWDAVRDAAKRAGEREKAKDLREATKQVIRIGQVAAGCDELGWYERARKMAQHAIERETVSLYHAHRATKAANRLKAAALVWKRLGTLRAEIKRRKDFAESAQRIKVARGAATALREWNQTITELTAEGRMLTASELQTIRNNTLRLLTHAHIGATLRAHISDYSAALNVALAEAVRIEQAEREEKLKHAVAEWLAGERGERYALHGLGRTLIRAVDVTRDENGTITGGKLETSQGADVPLTHAVRAFRFLKMCRMTGRTWERNGRSIRVGHFQIDSVQADGSFKAGCHVIGWAEVERLATQLGVFELPASDLAVESREHA